MSEHQEQYDKAVNAEQCALCPASPRHVTWVGNELKPLCNMHMLLVVMEGSSTDE